MHFLFPFAKRFIAGESINEALKRAKQLQKKNINTTLDILGEEVKNLAETRYAVQDYQKLIEHIREEKLNANVALKLTHLGLSISETVCKKNLEKVLSFAKKNNVIVEIDMEGSKYTAQTIQLYLEGLKIHPKAMIAIQMYLRRSKKDVELLLKQKARIRLVKGAYKESKTKAYQKKENVDKNYEQVMHLCLQKAEHSHIATHDEKLIMKAVKFIETQSISEEKYEFCFLLGVKEDLQKKTS